MGTKEKLMGTRVAYQINDSDGNAVATLFSNSSHETQFAEEVFRNRFECSLGPTELVERLLSARYTSAEGSHQVGDRIFWLVPPAEANDGDHERVIVATFQRRVDTDDVVQAFDSAGKRWGVTHTTET
jgi:hypothetical protein